MRIHVHLDPAQSRRQLTPAIWDDAVARAPDAGTDHEVSFGCTSDELAMALPHVELLVTTGSLPRPLPAEAPRLRFIFCTFAGVESLLPADWLPDGVVVLNNSGAHEAKAGEYAIMCILMLANRVPAYTADQRARRWDRQLGTVLGGRRLTVVGLGGLGSGAVRRARQFDMHITGVRSRPNAHEACDRVVGTNEFDAVLTGTEFLLLACPLTDATRHILDRRRIALLPRGAFVVNIGRGDLVEQDALCDALDGGQLGGAVLDVVTPEPPPPDHRLWTTPNLLLTPHISCDDYRNYLPNSMDVLMSNLRALRKAYKPPNQVDLKRGY